MAGRQLGSPGGRSEEACQFLLEKLKQGQVDLHRNLEHLRSPKKKGRGKRPSQEDHVRCERGGGGESPVKHLPVRRVRDEQLSPCTALHVPRRKHRKRLSSTPKLPSPAPFLPHLFLSSHTPPLTTLTPDTSLQDTPLPPPTTKSPTKSPGDRIRTKIAKFTESSGSKGENVSSGVSGTAVPGGLSRKKESKQVFDVSSDIRNSSVSRVAGESISIRSRYQSGNKKSQGLTVSFVTDENTQTERTEVKDGDSISGVGVGSRKGRSQGVWHGEGGKGEALVRSLNSSRFGALEHKRRRMSGGPMRTPEPVRGSSRNGPPPWTPGETRRLGYDWIAGLVEAGSGLEEREEGFFDEMREFRKVNHSECSRPHPLFLPDTESDKEGSTSPHTLPTSLSTPHTHCTQSYIMNNRLFPIEQRAHGASGEGGKRCPVCEGKREKEERDTRSIHYIRVSVPRRSVQAPYQLRPHRRRSFDPSDSMALNKHCLAGCNSSKPQGLPPQPTVDLRSNIHHPHPSPNTHPHPSPSTHPHPSPNSHPHPSPSTHPHHHIPTTTQGRRNNSSETRHLLNTSHKTEYSLRSRGHAS